MGVQKSGFICTRSLYRRTRSEGNGLFTECVKVKIPVRQVKILHAGFLVNIFVVIIEISINA